MLWLPILAVWGCIPELTRGCVDMTNSSSTYLGIVAGVAIGALISWWIYNRQKKTTILQDDILERIEKIEENNGKILAHLEAFANHHDVVLNKIVHMNEDILDLNKRIDSFGEEK
jgi:uncharacterized membrane-anchored protein YhcB (DUF1043 family)